MGVPNDNILASKALNEFSHVRQHFIRFFFPRAVIDDQNSLHLCKMVRGALAD